MAPPPPWAWPDAGCRPASQRKPSCPHQQLHPKSRKVQDLSSLPLSFCAQAPGTQIHGIYSAPAGAFRPRSSALELCSRHRGGCRRLLHRTPADPTPAPRRRCRWLPRRPSEGRQPPTSCRRRPCYRWKPNEECWVRIIRNGLSRCSNVYSNLSTPHLMSITVII